MNLGLIGDPVPHDNRDECITVPRIPSSLTRVDMAELQTTILD